MSFLGDIFGNIERLINEHGSSVILEQRVGLLNTQLALLKEHIEKLEKENARLIKESTELKHQLTRQQEGEQFIEARGASFKRISPGTYSKTPYCPYCRRAMSCLRHALPYKCSNKDCGHIADFLGVHLDEVIATLPK